MNPSKRTLAVTAVVLAVAGGGGAAVAASQGSSSADGFFDSLAEHLGISTDELEDAAKAAANDQVDAALEDGRITEEQARELKQRIAAGEGPFFFGPRILRGGPNHGGGHIFFTKFEAAAEYLELTAAELRERVENGQSLAQIARAEDKSVDGLKQALVDDAEARLDQAVEDEDLTRERADELLERLESHVDDFVNGTFEGRTHRPFGPGPDSTFIPDVNA